MASVKVTMIIFFHVVVVGGIDVVLKVKVVIPRDDLLVDSLRELGLTLLLPFELVLEVKVVLLQVANGWGLYESKSIGEIEKSLAEVIGIFHGKILDIFFAGLRFQWLQILVGPQGFLSVHQHSKIITL